MASSPGAVVLAAALPFLFLHADFQPGLTVHVGSTGITAELSDLAVLVVGLAALLAARARGFGPLRAGLPIWLAGAAFLAMVFAATLYPRLGDDRYRWAAHTVTAAKYAEYALLALALPLLIRRREDLRLLLGGLVAWSSAATAIGVLQFTGVSIFQDWGAGRRQPSFLGPHDFAALSGAGLAVGLAALALGSAWEGGTALAVVAVLAGGIGVVVSGSTAAAIGTVAAAVVAVLVGHRRARISLRRVGAALAIAAIVAAGVVVLRSGDFDQFLRFAGLRPEQQKTRANVQTYAQRTVLVYLGARIFLDNPIAGVGWQGSAEEQNFGPYLADAHRKFPDTAGLGFPSAEHPYGVQNVYVQTVADMGAVGFALLVALVGAGLVLGVRAALRAPPPLALAGLVASLWLLVTMGIWTAVGLVAGIPTDALEWLALGLAATAAWQARRARA